MPLGAKMVVQVFAIYSAVTQKRLTPVEASQPMHCITTGKQSNTIYIL